jgi:predicted transglutaminase-like cysteine proteinase
MEAVKSTARLLLVLTMSFVLFAATYLHYRPGTPFILEAFVDKATYAFLTQNSWHQWLEMNKRYYGQDVILPEDLRLPNIYGISERTISLVNFVVNNIQYQHDEVTYGALEYFATPYEMLRSGAGDCEDYAILKMYLLLGMGFPAEDMFLIAGLYDNGIDVGGHAVLGLRIDGNIWILDNMRNSIIPLSQYNSFEPFAAMNWNGYYLFGDLKY